MRVALFTAFSPDTGGGVIQLKSLLPELRDLRIEWYYLSHSEAHSYPGRWLGPPLSAATVLSDLFARTKFLPGSVDVIETLVSKIDADVYWVVAHNEGVLVAAELCAAGKKVHLTVHDDPSSVFARSRKYRAVQFLMSIIFSRVVKAAASVDVTSPAMRDIYKERFGVDCFPQFCYVPALVKANFTPDNSKLRVGHIGTLYHPKPFRCFVRACRSYSATQRRQLRIVTIGRSKHMDAISSENRDIFENAGELREEPAIQLLATCDLAYAMYPAGRRFRLFRQTSFPVKLTTYVRAQRPIFAHTPMDSTLASAVSRYGIGEVCSTNTSRDIEVALSQLFGKTVLYEQFEAFRADLLGSSHIPDLRMALGA